MTADLKNEEWVELNVGGTKFLTTKATLCQKEPESMLARLFSEDKGVRWTTARDSTGAYLIDRSPRHFESLLNYLRHGQLVIDPGVSAEGVLEEAKFFGFQSVVERLTESLQANSKFSGRECLNRCDVVDILTRSHLVKEELRFQGINMSGADLSYLDLRHINFKFANLSGADLTGATLSYSNFERANMTGVKLDSAHLLGVRMLCTNLEGASMKGCNFEDPTGARAVMEGANLKNSILESSQMGGVNLRVATLKQANMRNCDLRGAVLAGADLQNCDLTGSDLHEANLRGANLAGAILELMMTPLHMSQTI